MKLKLMQKVKIDYALKRINGNNVRTWEKKLSYGERVGRVIGIRTLSDVEFKDHFDPDFEDFNHTVIKRHKVALVIFNMIENPVYVPLTAITIL